jgi:hypothetical protein
VPVRGLLLINPRAGKEEPTTATLESAAWARGIDVHVLQEGEDPAELARAAETEMVLETPIERGIEAGALRVLVPRPPRR